MITWKSPTQVIYFVNKTLNLAEMSQFGYINWMIRLPVISFSSTHPPYIISIIIKVFVREKKSATEKRKSSRNFFLVKLNTKPLKFMKKSNLLRGGGGAGGGGRYVQGTWVPPTLLSINEIYIMLNSNIIFRYFFLS